MRSVPALKYNAEMNYNSLSKRLTITYPVYRSSGKAPSFCHNLANRTIFGSQILSDFHFFTDSLITVIINVFVMPVAVLVRKIWGHGPKASAVSEPIKGVVCGCPLSRVGKAPGLVWGDVGSPSRGKAP